MLKCDPSQALQNEIYVLPLEEHWINVGKVKD